MTDIFWRKNACALNCMFLRQGYKSFFCAKLHKQLETGNDGAPTASPNCTIIKTRREDHYYEKQPKD